jgi:hypothetical protein
MDTQHMNHGNCLVAMENHPTWVLKIRGYMKIGNLMRSRMIEQQTTFHSASKIREFHRTLHVFTSKTAGFLQISPWRKNLRHQGSLAASVEFKHGPVHHSLLAGCESIRTYVYEWQETAKGPYPHYHEMRRTNELQRIHMYVIVCVYISIYIHMRAGIHILYVQYG